MTGGSPPACSSKLCSTATDASWAATGSRVLSSSISMVLCPAPPPPPRHGCQDRAEGLVFSCCCFPATVPNKVVFFFPLQPPNRGTLQRSHTRPCGLHQRLSGRATRAKRLSKSLMSSASKSFHRAPKCASPRQVYVAAPNQTTTPIYSACQPTKRKQGSNGPMRFYALVELHGLGPPAERLA